MGTMTPVYRDATWVLTQTKTRISASVGRASVNSKVVVGAHDPLLHRWEDELFLLCGGLDLAEAGTGTNDDMDLVGWGCLRRITPSSSTSASTPVSSSLALSSSSSSLMLMKFRWRTALGTRPGVRERPSRHASALERSALRLRTVREEATVVAGERDMKDSCRVRRKLGDESGDTGDGAGSTWLDVRDGE